MRTLTCAVLITGAIAALGAAPLQVYRATFDYDYASLEGVVTRRERITGTYTRDPQAKTATWTNVTTANGPGADTLGAAAPSTFMAGFTYPLKAANVTTNEFFRDAVPPTATKERNLVWDTRMFEVFGEEQWAHLTPNTPYHFSPGSDVQLAGSGTFTNRDVQLTLTGTTVRNGASCLVVDYVALFNHVQMSLSATPGPRPSGSAPEAPPGLTMVGRSHYWGQVWVTASTKQIVAATLYEDVLAEVGDGHGPATPVNVFRIGTFERVGTR